ncbi:alpha/beta hydrolase, partial [Escherichia coli]
MTAALLEPVSRAFTEPAADGYLLGGFEWRQRTPDSTRAVVI